MRRLSIDSMNGGNGDIWMRLVSFYSIAGLYPDIRIRILVPKFLRGLAEHTFGDRITIAGDTDNDITLRYSSLGLRHLAKGFFQGYRYILPYQRAVIQDKKKKEFKDTINTWLFNIADQTGLVHIPALKWTTSYQGFLDIIGINLLKKTSYTEFTAQLQKDSVIVFERLNTDIPVSPELSIPGDLKDSVVIFPTGTSRQFIPVSWAVEHLPHAYYAFFHKDKDGETFREHGLKTIHFYQEPGDIIFLSSQAKWTVSTDSFPSHLLQYSAVNCTITITEVLKSRIISPVFRGKVIDAQVGCHPCLHLDRSTHPVCAAGFNECENWTNDRYTRNLINSIPR